MGVFRLLCGVYLSPDATSRWHCSWRLCWEKCRTMGPVKMQLQSGGEKPAKTCSFYCMGLMLKPSARIPMPQMFKPWPRAKEGPATAEQEEGQCDSPL